MIKKPFFSIVIPTLNEAKYLPHLLGDLEKQTFNQFEVTVVDSNSNDQTISLAKKYQTKLDLKIVTTKKRHVAYQRNIGGAKSQGKWIIFLDADVRISHYFLEGINYQLHKNPQIALFTTWIDADGDSAAAKVIAQGMSFWLEMYLVAKKPVAVYGAMLGAKNTLIKKIKFDPKQKICEDVYFVKNAVSNGFNYKVFKEPKYVFSLRRLRKEGVLTIAKMSIMLQINSMLNKDFKSNFGYVMEGGTYYDKKTNSMFHLFQNYIKTAPLKQIKQAKKLFSQLKHELTSLE